MYESVLLLERCGNYACQVSMGEVGSLSAHGGTFGREVGFGNLASLLLKH